MDNEMIVRKILTKAIGNIENILAGKIDRCDAISGVCLQVSKARWDVLDELCVYSSEQKDAISQDIENVMSFIFRNWPLFSGNITYPVGCDDFSCPEAAFDYHMDNGGMWDIHTQYGRDRMHLARWVIEGFKGFLWE